MTAQGWLQIALYVAVLTALTPLIGAYMYRVYTGERVMLTRVLGPVERLVYRLLRTDPEQSQDWKGYARTTVIFSALSFLALYAILRTQGIHPLNPEGYGSAPWDVSFNNAASFVSNTNWQFYGGETTLSYFSQMAGLAVQNFLSAAVGMAVLIAVVRGFVSRSGAELGNFWADTTRTLLYVLLPISVVVGLLLISQGTLQSLAHYVTYPTVTGGEQTLALGPVGSQEIIKELGTNGGGFFNVNSAMPFENPNGLTNFAEMLLILVIPAGLTATFGRMAGNRRLGWALYCTMAVMFVAGVAIVYAAEDQRHAGTAPGGPGGQQPRRQGGALRRCDVRAVAVVITTVASCGAVNLGARCRSRASAGPCRWRT